VKDEEAQKLFMREKLEKERIKQLSRKLDQFLNNHKGEWFTALELAKELDVTVDDVLDAFFMLKWKLWNWFRFEYKDFGFRQPHIYRKRW
jgi:hypothetical protein